MKKQKCRNKYCEIFQSGYAMRSPLCMEREAKKLFERDFPAKPKCKQWDRKRKTCKQDGEPCVGTEGACDDDKN